MSDCKDKTQLYFRLKDQKSHYKRIVEVKKIINFKKIEESATTCANQNHKYQRFRNREIRENNLKLFNKILQIKNKNGLLQSIEKQPKQKKPKTQAIQNLSTLQRIQQENMKFIQRLVNVKPQVGTISQWQQEFRKSRINQKRIHKFIKNQSIDPDEYIRQTLSRISKKRNDRNYTSLGYRPVQRDINDKTQFTKLQSSTHRDYIQNQQTISTVNKQKKKKKHKNVKKRISHLQFSQKLSINNIILSKKYDCQYTMTTDLQQQ